MFFALIYSLPRQVEEQSRQLVSRLSQLKDAAFVRRLRFLDAVESQTVRLGGDKDKNNCKRIIEK